MQPVLDIALAGSTGMDIKAFCIISSEMMYLNNTTMTSKGTVYLYKALNFETFFLLQRNLLFKSAPSPWIKPRDPILPPQLMSRFYSRGVIHML